MNLCHSKFPLKKSKVFQEKRKIGQKEQIISGLAKYSVLSTILLCSRIKKVIL